MDLSIFNPNDLKDVLSVDDIYNSKANAVLSNQVASDLNFYNYVDKDDSDTSNPPEMLNGTVSEKSIPVDVDKDIYFLYASVDPKPSEAS